MGQYERQLRKTQILAAAARLFASKGFGSSKMADIAKEAGLSVGNVYFYYKNKEDLYIAVTLKACEQTIEMIEETREEMYESNALETIMGVIQKYMNFNTNYHDYQSVLSNYISMVINIANGKSQFGLTPKMMASQYFEPLQQKQWIPAQLMVKLIRRGKFQCCIENPEPPHLIFVNIWSILIGYNKIFINENDLETIKTVVSTPHIDISAWRNSQLNLIRNYLKG